MHPLVDWLLECGERYIISNHPVNKLELAKPLCMDSSSSPAPHDLHSVQSLDALKNFVHNFNDCELKKGANNMVFADGDSTAKLMLIGEAPGAEEDKTGVPFCGRSGKLLDNIFKSIGLTRQELYITNTVFWRPPGNRRPTNEELAICKPIVDKHISLVAPQMIVLVGSTAVEAMLGINKPMHEMRGQIFNYHNSYLKCDIPCMVILHPSYLLRQPNKKKLMWLDMLFLRQQKQI